MVAASSSETPLRKVVEMCRRFGGTWFSTVKIEGPEKWGGAPVAQNHLARIRTGMHDVTTTQRFEFNVIRLLGEV